MMALLCDTRCILPQLKAYSPRLSIYVNDIYKIIEFNWPQNTSLGFMLIPVPGRWIFIALHVSERKSNRK